MLCKWLVVTSIDFLTLRELRESKSSITNNTICQNETQSSSHNKEMNWIRVKNTVKEVKKFKL
jgi:hypothetical protein